MHACQNLGSARASKLLFHKTTIVSHRGQAPQICIIASKKSGRPDNLRLLREHRNSLSARSANVCRGLDAVPDVCNKSQAAPPPNLINVYKSGDPVFIVSRASGANSRIDSSRFLTPGYITHVHHCVPPS